MSSVEKTAQVTSKPIYELSSLQIKNVEKKFDKLSNDVVSLAQLLGKDIVIKTLEKDGDHVCDVITNRLHLLTSEKQPLTIPHEDARASLFDVDIQTNQQILKKEVLRDYLRLLKRQFGKPSEEPLGRIKNMSLPVSKVLVLHSS